MMKTFLDEAKGEYIFITSEAQKMEQQIQEKDEVLLENAELIRNLEAQLGQMSMHSEEQSKMIENLEEKLEHQSALLSSAEIAVRDPPTKEINSKHITRDIIEREPVCGVRLLGAEHVIESTARSSITSGRQDDETITNDIGAQDFEQQARSLVARGDLHHQHHDDMLVRAQCARAPRIDQRQKLRSPVCRSRLVTPPTLVTRDQQQPRLHSPVVDNRCAAPRTRTPQAVEDRHCRRYRSPRESDDDSLSPMRGHGHRRRSSSPPARERRHW
ncbi:hypothetical protein QAD02_013857 [Eretmocerus hayati]|uniref:Uncharacterized protein n=1 Tax=Eretmocerus hayati TaxID=131215 RepID=A0ACC2P3B4_9HYME|nr:hypothetical protein QAD02_013857 [Eretmocerus hayati]